MTEIVAKRVYEEPQSSDGFRVLVDKLWPRGVKKEALQFDAWNKEIEPSRQLREWFHQNKEENWDGFKMKYEAELKQSEAVKDFAEMIKIYEKVTLLYAAKDPNRNHLLILIPFLESLVN